MVKLVPRIPEPLFTRTKIWIFISRYGEGSKGGVAKNKYVELLTHTTSSRTPPLANRLVPGGGGGVGGFPKQLKQL